MLLPIQFSADMDKIINFARRLMLEFNNKYIGTEHIFLSLVKYYSNDLNEINTNLNYSSAYKILKNSLIIDEDDNLPTEETVLDAAFGDKENTYKFTPEAERILVLCFEHLKSIKRRVLMPYDVFYTILNNATGSTAILLELLLVDIRSILNYLDYKYSINVPDVDTQEDVDLSLDKFTVDITEKAKNNELDPFIGREFEFSRINQILGRRSKNNVVLVGEPGVGKTAIVEGLALAIANKKVPTYLSDKRILSLDLAAIVAGSKYRGDFEERLKKLLNEIKDLNNVILYIDEIHTIVGAGSSSGSLDAANILKPSLSRGEIKCIGATTLDEYRKYFEKDRALERRFEPVFIKETTKAETIEIIHKIKDKYEEFHNVKISDDAIESSVNLSDRYIKDRYLPDKAITILDEACSKAKLQISMVDPKEIELQNLIEKHKKEKNEMALKANFEKAAISRDLVLKYQTEYEKLKNKNSKNKKIPLIKKSDIESVISNQTGINIEKISKDEIKRLKNLDKMIAARIKGQDEAVNAICKVIRRSRVGLQDPNKPLGSFIFLGPTGVGKTELCRVLNDLLFDDPESFVKIDMSEYMEKHSVSKLIGSPPGYVGYEEGGQLTNIVRKHPYSLILLDEIEKAHPDIYNLLLQVLEDGVLTDSEGRTVNFKNTIIVMTSNAGAHDIVMGKSLGFENLEQDKFNKDKLKHKVMDAVKQIFRPEFLNRIDDLIIFNKLDKTSIKQIIKLQLSDLSNRMNVQNIKIKFTDSVVDFILEKSYSDLYGARPIKRCIQTEIIDKISDAMINSIVLPNTSLKIGIKNKKVHLYI